MDKEKKKVFLYDYKIDTTKDQIKVFPEDKSDPHGWDDGACYNENKIPCKYFDEETLVCRMRNSVFKPWVEECPFFKEKEITKFDKAIDVIFNEIKRCPYELLNYKEQKGKCERNNYRCSVCQAKECWKQLFLRGRVR